MEKLQTGQKVEWCTLQELDQLTARKVAEEAAKGDKLAQSIYETSAIYLGKGLSMVIDILNPEVIVIGGIYTRNKKYDGTHHAKDNRPGGIILCKQSM